MADHPGRIVKNMLEVHDEHNLKLVMDWFLDHPESMGIVLVMVHIGLFAKVTAEQVDEATRTYRRKKILRQMYKCKARMLAFVTRGPS